MALLEDHNSCCICDARCVYRLIGGVPAYYCVKCFEEHKDDILKGSPWVRFLMNVERQRRKRRNRLLTSGVSFAAASYCDGFSIMRPGPLTTWRVNN